MNNVDGSGEFHLTNDPGRILFSRGRLEGTPRLDVVVMDADGSGELVLTHHPADDFSPAWSPDKRWVTLVSDRTSNWELYVIGADAQRLNRITRTHPFEFDPSWGARP